MLHPRSDNPSGHDRPEVIVSCTDCGCRYNSYGQVLSDRYIGRRGSRWCPDCRKIRVRAFEQHEHNVREARLRFQREAWVQDNRRGIPELFRGKDFSNFDLGGNEDRVSALRKYAETFPVDSRPKGAQSILIARDINGVGKTHLTCAILRTIIDRSSDIDREVCPYQFWPIYRIKQRLLDAQRFNGAETVAQVYLDFASMWLLVIDDVGKDLPSGYEAAAAYEMYFTIINERYNAQLPIIVSSNLGFAPWASDGLCLQDLMGKACASRLMEMTGGVEYVIEGKDRR